MLKMINVMKMDVELSDTPTNNTYWHTPNRIDEKSGIGNMTGIIQVGCQQC